MCGARSLLLILPSITKHNRKDRTATPISRTPATNIAVACALLLAGPGALSLDRLLGIRVPWWVSLLAMAATAGGVLLVLEDDISELAAQVRAQEREAEVAEPEELPAAT